MEPIQIYLIGGFLGAGKTTLLLSLLEQWSDRRLGVIVNEFGAIGVDGVLLEQDGVRLVEINHGSIFCSCLKDGFVRTLQAFSQQPIDILLIENSGLADPAGMARLLAGLATYLQRPYQYQGLLCLVDAESFLDYAEVLRPLESQVREAALLVVNKTDLAQPEQLAEIHSLLSQWNDHAPIYDTTYARLPWPLPRLTPADSGRGAADRAASRPASLLLTSSDQPQAEQLRAFCQALAACIWRIKGFTRAGAGWLYTDATARQIRVSEGGEPPRTGLVILGPEAADLEETVRAAWQRCCGPNCELSRE